jgi:hypothetical protein
MGILAVVLVAAAAWAVDSIIIGGTVTKMAGDTITVTVETNSVDVVLLPTTKYVVGAKPAQRSDLMLGDTVAATVLRVGKDWQAQKVKITHPKKK